MEAPMTVAPVWSHARGQQPDRPCANCIHRGDPGAKLTPQPGSTTRYIIVSVRVMRAVKVLTDPRAGVRLKASSVTVSTVGLVPQIEQFCKDAGNGASLALSLHAVTDEIRDKV